MNCLTAARVFLRDVEKEARLWTEAGLDCEAARSKAEATVMARMDRQMEVAYMLQQRMKDTKTRLGLDVKSKYFVTVRPDASKVTFDAFKDIAFKFAGRKCMTAYELVFEQKGVTEDTLGVGFHVHMIVDTTMRSKAELLRAACSTFGFCTAANCVQVDTLRGDADVARVRSYIRDHESADGHKEITRKWDALWRESLELRPLYESCLSSPDGSSSSGV